MQRQEGPSTSADMVAGSWVELEPSDIVQQIDPSSAACEDHSVDCLDLQNMHTSLIESALIQYCSLHLDVHARLNDRGVG